MMGRHRKTMVDLDRFLSNRDGKFYYKRRVPSEVADSDERAPVIRLSLKTTDLAKARALRDLYEKADDDLWASLVLDVSYSAAHKKYLGAVKRAAALNFTYRPVSELAAGNFETILERIEMAISGNKSAPVIDALLGAVEKPKVPITKAFETYRDEIVPHTLLSKSPGQRKRWTNGKFHSVEDFVSVVGNLAMEDLDRESAREYYSHWLAKVAPKSGRPTHTASIANRRLGDLRVLYREYFTFLGEPDRPNPFDKLSFSEKKNARKRKRPPFPIEWITGKILKPGALAALNDEARHIAMVVADIGARPSEICNLAPSMIVLKHETPHIRIEPRDDPDDPREIKTDSSIRIVPLTGLALAVMKKYPSGFQRYKDKEDSLSAALNKFFRENKLFPSDAHTIYSFRHSFEDRMKEAKIDAEMRRLLMGHAIDRPEYGEGGSLKLRLDAMKKIALPFDPTIVQHAP